MQIYYLEKFVSMLINEKAFPALARITKINGERCECIELTNFEEETPTIFPNVRIPKFIASKDGGIWAKPQIGSLVLLNFLNGDLNFSIISAIINAKDS
ncbi:MAG: hypothetical protein ACRC0X_06350, partial [Brevinema sp.]